NMSYTHFEGKSTDEDGSSASSGNIFAISTQIAPIYPLYIRDAQGNPMIDENGLVMYDYGDGNNAGLKRNIFAQSNAISSNILDTNKYGGNAATATGFAEIRFLKDFRFTTTNSVTLDETRTTNVTNPYYGSYASSNGILGKYHTRSYSYSFQQLLNYLHSFGKHNVEVMVGHESYRNKYTYLYASKSNMFDPGNHELAGAVNDGSSNSYTTDYNTEGFFGRLQYNYDEKYFASMSYRRDASSRFHPDNRWGNFWSFGAAWLLSKESWFDIDWVDMLKVKASYGEQGNDNIGNYRYTNTFNIVNSSGNPAAVPNTMGNKDITWEKGGNFNIGVDFDLFKGRLSGTLEYFYRKTSDMLFSFPLPISFGYTSYYANVGDMRNSGLELEVRGDVVRTKDFTWNIGLNLTHYKNKITYLPEERKTMEVEGIQGYSSGNLYYGEGISLYTFHLQQYAGVDPETGASMWYKNVKDSNGNPTGEKTTTTNYSEADYYLCGSALPDLYGGFNTSFAYKGLDLSVDFAYQLGGKVYDSDYASAMSSPTSTSKGRAFHEDILNAWTPTNTSSNIPRLQYADNYSSASSDRFLTSASYLSLQNISLGYTLPATLTRHIGIEKLRVYFAADNVWIWSKRQGLDPRQSMLGESTASYYAPIRSISGGLTVTF
ncbi:MAG: SusC/RagA family TonB-linked outer membrane protein, partial [Phocaeicola sp.]|nr:SusC/RagA family TonB-linked outer membrane protein [Phocaeicola sp.]